MWDMKMGNNAEDDSVTDRIESAVLTILLDVSAGGEGRNSFADEKKGSGVGGKSIANRIAKTARYTAVLDHIHELRHGKRHSTLREFFYQNINVFGSQNAADSVVADATRLLKCPRESLNIVNCPRGLVRGHILIDERMPGELTSNWTDCMSPFEPRGHRISPLASLTSVTPVAVNDVLPNSSPTSYPSHSLSGGHVTRIQTSPLVGAPLDFVLVVEKETLYFRLIEERIFDRWRCVLITGHGYPDFPTRILLRRLYESFGSRHGSVTAAANDDGVPPPPFFVLCDADADGVTIAATYAFGVQSSKWFIPQEIHVPSLQLITPTASEAVKLYGLPKSECRPLTRRDKQRLKRQLCRMSRITEREAMISPCWEKVISTMLSAEVAFEADALLSLHALISSCLDASRGHRALKTEIKSRAVILDVH